MRYCNYKISNEDFYLTEKVFTSRGVNDDTDIKDDHTFSSFSIVTYFISSLSVLERAKQQPHTKPPAHTELYNKKKIFTSSKRRRRY